MTTSAIVISMVIALAVAQVVAVSPWLARRIVRLAARLRYGDTARGRTRAEDLAAYIETCPGPLLNLGAALCFLAVGSAAVTQRGLRGFRRRRYARIKARGTRWSVRVRPYRVRSRAFGLGFGTTILAIALALEHFSPLNTVQSTQGPLEFRGVPELALMALASLAFMTVLWVTGRVIRARRSRRNMVATRRRGQLARRALPPGR